MRDLGRLASFGAVFREATFTVGQWGKAGFDYAPEVRGFCDFCYDDDWVLSGFDWVEWKATPGAESYRQPQAILDHATQEDLARLLTVAIRQERFVEGALAGWFESGLIQAICTRAGLLAA